MCRYLTDLEGDHITSNCTMQSRSETPRKACIKLKLMKLKDYNTNALFIVSVGVE